MGRKVYDDFVALVGAARKLSPAELDAVARGRVWTGVQVRVPSPARRHPGSGSGLH